MSSSTPDDPYVFRKFFGAIAAAFLIFFIFIRPGMDERAAKRAAEHEKEMEQIKSQKEAEAYTQQQREQGARALEAADQAIRQEATDRRRRLEKASSSVRTTNNHGVRVDQYILKKGGVISCTTTVSGNSPAMFNCDGDV